MILGIDDLALSTAASQCGVYRWQSGLYYIMVLCNDAEELKNPRYQSNTLANTLLHLVLYSTAVCLS